MVIDGVRLLRLTCFALRRRDWSGDCYIILAASDRVLSDPVPLVAWDRAEFSSGELPGPCNCIRYVACRATTQAGFALVDPVIAYFVYPVETRSRTAAERSFR